MDWFTGELVYWWIGLLVNWFTGGLVYWWIGLLVDWFSGGLVYFELVFYWIRLDLYCLVLIICKNKKVMKVSSYFSGLQIIGDRDWILFQFLTDKTEIIKLFRVHILFYDVFC